MLLYCNNDHDDIDDVFYYNNPVYDINKLNVPFKALTNEKFNLNTQFIWHADINKIAKKIYNLDFFFNPNDKLSLINNIYTMVENSSYNESIINFIHSHKTKKNKYFNNLTNHYIIYLHHSLEKLLSKHNIVSINDTISFNQQYKINKFLQNQIKNYDLIYVVKINNKIQMAPKNMHGILQNKIIDKPFKYKNHKITLIKKIYMPSNCEYYLYTEIKLITSKELMTLINKLIYSNDSKNIINKLQYYIYNKGKDNLLQVDYKIVNQLNLDINFKIQLQNRKIFYNIEHPYITIYIYNDKSIAMKPNIIDIKHKKL